MTSGNLNISLSNDTAHNKLPGERVKYDRYENFNGITGMLTLNNRLFPLYRRCC